MYLFTLLQGLLFDSRMRFDFSDSAAQQGAALLCVSSLEYFGYLMLTEGLSFNDGLKLMKVPPAQITYMNGEVMKFFIQVKPLMNRWIRRL